MSNDLIRHYECYPYPRYPLLASVRRCDTYALSLEALWARFNGRLPPAAAQRILVAGCGSFAPYPFAVANPKTPITALDLSQASLRRARLHCLLHGRLNVSYRCGDLLDRAAVDGRFGLIDAFGVLHHLPDPLAGLRALADRLVEGGILRVMVYSRYARREEEAIRSAFRLLGVTTPAAARRLIDRSPPGSRLRRYADRSFEAQFEAGLADALLHPRVTTYRIDPLMEMIRCSGLQPLLFAHQDARADIGQELERLRALERERRSPGNFILYLGRNPAGEAPDAPGSHLLLNPCLGRCVGPLHLGTLHIAPRLGHANPPLTHPERRVLRRFLRPLPCTHPAARHQSVPRFQEALFLLRYRD